MKPNLTLQDEFFIEKVLAARRRSFEEKFLAAGRLYEAAIERMRMGVLMNRPDATEEEIEVEIERWWEISRQSGKSLEENIANMPQLPK